MMKIKLLPLLLALALTAALLLSGCGTQEAEPETAAPVEEQAEIAEPTAEPEAPAMTEEEAAPEEEPEAAPEPAEAAEPEAAPSEEPASPEASGEPAQDAEAAADAGEQNVYVLEAEHTNLEGKYGSGYSGSTTGTGMVIGDDTDNRTASNGYYVGWLYYPGAFLGFEFEAEEDIDDLTLVFRLSAQYNSVDVTGDQVYVGINYDEASGSYEQTFDFPFHADSYSEMSSAVMDFRDYLVVENVSVKKGLNTIELVINNDIKGVGGTMKAAAPLVDCLYLYTDKAITPVVYNPEF